MFDTRTNVPNIPDSLRNKIITEYPNSYDTSFGATAIILLYSRVNDLKISVNVIDAEKSNYINTDPDVYSFYMFSNAKNPDEFLKPYKKNVKTIEKLSTHEKFISNQLKTQVYIRLMPEENTVCIFSSGITIQAWHCLQFFIPKYFKVFKEKPLSKEEIYFLESLTFKTNTHYLTRFTELANTDSFKKFILKDQLESFEKRLFELKVQNAQLNLSKLEETMNSAMAMYKTACEKRIEALALVSGLKTMADNIEEHTELQDYLINNPRICNVKLNGSEISYIVKTYLAPYYIEEWDTISRNINYFNQFANSRFNNIEIKLLLDSILSENRSLKLKMCAYFRMDYFGATVTSQAHYPFVMEDKTLVDYMPNPHLNLHNCFSQNKLAILEQLKCGDAIGAIECSVACAQRININESMTFKPFVLGLLSSSGKCFVSDDGIEMSPEEAVAYLKGKTNE